MFENLSTKKGGGLGKPSSPGAKARADARKDPTTGARLPKESRSNGGFFVEGLLQNPSRRSRPAAANRLAQKFRPGGQAGGNGFFGRFSTRPTPNPHNPECGGGPKSVTVVSSQSSSNKSSSANQKVRTMRTHDGYDAALPDDSANHFTSKHGHDFGINDPFTTSREL